MSLTLLQLFPDADRMCQLFAFIDTLSAIQLFHSNSNFHRLFKEPLMERQWRLRVHSLAVQKHCESEVVNVLRGQEQLEKSKQHWRLTSIQVCCVLLHRGCQACSKHPLTRKIYFPLPDRLCKFCFQSETVRSYTFDFHENHDKERLIEGLSALRKSGWNKYRGDYAHFAQDAKQRWMTRMEEKNADSLRKNQQNTERVQEQTKTKSVSNRLHRRRDARKRSLFIELKKAHEIEGTDEQVASLFHTILQDSNKSKLYIDSDERATPLRKQEAVAQLFELFLQQMNKKGEQTQTGSFQRRTLWEVYSTVSYNCISVVEYIDNNNSFLILITKADQFH